MPFRSTSHLSAIALIASVSVAACHGDDITTSRSANGEPQRSIGALVTRGPATIDDRFDALTESVPGFGGLFYDANGRLAVYVKKPATLSSASRNAIAAFLARERSGVHSDQAAIDAANATVLPATYDFHELLTFYRSVVVPAVPTIVGITSGDIDETKNRIVIGIGSADLIPVAQARVAQRIMREC